MLGQTADTSLAWYRTTPGGSRERIPSQECYGPRPREMSRCKIQRPIQRWDDRTLATMNGIDKGLDVDGNVPYKPILSSVHGRTASRLHQEESRIDWKVNTGSVWPWDPIFAKGKREGTMYLHILFRTNGLDPIYRQSPSSSNTSRQDASTEASPTRPEKVWRCQP